MDSLHPFDELHKERVAAMKVIGDMCMNFAAPAPPTPPPPPSQEPQSLADFLAAEEEETLCAETLCVPPPPVVGRLVMSTLRELHEVALRAQMAVYDGRNEHTLLAGTVCTRLPPDVITLIYAFGN